MIKRSGLVSAAIIVSASATASQAESQKLQPFQMVRSLEQVQDRIAGGDHAALPMQRKLLEMIDARFAANDDIRFENELNRRALLVYAMSGGNPTTVELSLSRLGKDDPVFLLGNGILAYIKGEPNAARQALEPISPMAYTPDLGAYLALVKASAFSEDQPETALKLLDQARLLSPGTLVDEAALRRSISLAVTLGDNGRFTRSADQYVRSYLRSPYASQFADSFVAGVIALHATLDLHDVSDIAAMMDAEQERVIYLRIARRAAIDGLSELAAFASARAEGEAEDPRALLYSSLSTVTSGTVGEVLGKLSQIDRDRLSENDRQLLDAASAIATEMTAAPSGLPDSVAKAEISSVRSTGEAVGNSIEEVEKAQPGASASHEEQAQLETASAADATSGSDEAANETEALIANVRAKLSDIDKMLGEMPE